MPYRADFIVAVCPAWQRPGKPKESNAINILIELLDHDRFDKIERFDDQELLLSMDKHDYGWLSVDNYKCGVDFYFQDGRNNKHHREFLREFIGEDLAGSARRANKLQDFPFDRAAEVGHSWFFRGAVGRSRATWLLAGFAAAALARLTDGILYSDDGGADCNRMPESPDRFLDWFPEWCIGVFPEPDPL
jgi:hypothetical protein